MPAMIYQNGAWKEAETPKAYSGGAFVDTEGKVYQNGAWVDAWSNVNVLKLLVAGTARYTGMSSAGIIQSSLTDVSDGKRLLVGRGQRAYGYGVTTQMFDLTNISSMKITLSATFNGTEYNVWGGVVKNNTYTATKIKNSNNGYYFDVRRGMAPYNNSTYSNLEITIDLSGFTGNYYIVPIMLHSYDGLQQVVTMHNIKLL